MKYNLQFKSEKCKWLKKEIKFLEFIIKRNLIKIDFNKLKAIHKWKTFINVKKIQFFLKFVNYNQKFIKHCEGVGFGGGFGEQQAIDGGTATRSMRPASTTRVCIGLNR